MPTSSRRVAHLLALLVMTAWPAADTVADEHRFAEEATVGMSLPGSSVAGDHDGTAVSVNPAGLTFLGDYHLELAFTGLDEDHAEGPGGGLGFFAATPVALPLLPRLGFGVAIEQLLPPRIALAPDPGTAVRYSLAAAYEWRHDVSFGAAWRHFSDDASGPLDGIDSLDLGFSARAGAYWAVGAVVHDVTTPVVAGVPSQRRYQVELVSRPLGSDRLELGLGATLGERRLDLDPSFRFGVRLTDGLYLRGEVAALSRFELVDPAFDAGESRQEYGVRASLGLEVSFGQGGAALYGTGGHGAAGGTQLLGATAIVRWSGERLPTVVPSGDHMERIELSGTPTSPQLTSILLSMRRMERDPTCKAVLVKIDGLGTGWGLAQELRDALHRLRQRGKKVVAFMSAGTTRDYYVAAAADKILLDAGGGLRVQGMIGLTLYYKGLFDKLGVNAQFEKIEEYKSAPEAFTQEGPSEAAKMVRDSLFDDTFERVTADIAADRHLSVEQVKSLIDGGPYTAAEAGKAKLVDAVVEPADADIAVAEALGGRLYPLTGGPQAERPTRWESTKIAVIYIDGDIIDGKSRTVPFLGTRMVGGETISDAIAQARNDPSVAAVVLRVDSPGGSALASEYMAREVLDTRGVKPVIVSMGDIAASGGYYAAAYGELVYAEPGTITGSIGIFTGKVDVSGLLAKLGITWVITTRGKHADQESYYRPYTEEERKTTKEKLRYYYGRFVAAVAKGRGMKFEQVDAIARGRVWTGAQAQEHHLVDKLGGVVDAIAEAKRRAGLPEDEKVQIVSLPAEPESVLGQVLRLAGMSASEGGAGLGAMRLAELPLVGDLLALLPGSLLVAPDVPQARLPFAIQLQ
jgi:protease-4